jgi:hypothetical protein
VFLYGLKRTGRSLPTLYVFEYVIFQDRSELRIWWVSLHPHKYELVTSRKFNRNLTVRYICCHNIVMKKYFKNITFFFLTVRKHIHKKRNDLPRSPLLTMSGTAGWFHELNNCRLFWHVSFRHRHICYYYGLKFCLSCGYENDEILRIWEFGELNMNAICLYSPLGASVFVGFLSCFNFTG